jgi:threonyl-tRNA synthetase
MTYIDQSGNKTRPVMVHRALLGSLERFFGVLVEHHGGAFPVWLAPVQAVLLAVCERRVDADDSNEKIGQKIRHHLFQEKVPFVAVVGDQEVQNGTVTVRSRTEGDLGAMPQAAFRELLQQKDADRS